MSSIQCGDMMISFEWFRFFIAISKFVPLKVMSFSRIFCRVVVGRPLLRGPSGLQSRTFFGYFVMTQHMTCHRKTPLSHDGDDPWEGVILGWSCEASCHVLSFLQHSCVGAIQCMFYCLC